MPSKSTPLLIGLTIITLLLSVFALQRSGSAPTGASSASNTTLTRVQQTKKMQVCYAVWPPAVIKDAKTGKLSGHDIDALEHIAAQIEATIEYHETTFGNMAAAIQSGQCDIGTSLFVKIPRAAAVAFSKPLFFGGNSGLVRKGDARFKTIEDVDKPGVKVAVATGESGHIYAKDRFKQAEVISIDVESSDLSRFLLEVSSGRADIGLADADTIRLFAANHPETEDVFANKTFDLNPDAWPVRHGDTDWLNFIDSSLSYLQTSGQWAAWEQKYDAHRIHLVEEYRAR